MHIDINDKVAVERHLWDEIGKGPVGMLGVTGGRPHHTRPMTAIVEPETKQLWFFTDKTTELVQEIASGSRAMFIHQQKDLQACISGQLTQQHDRGRVDKYWNAMIAAWFSGGKDDPKLTLLRLECDDAQVWISDVGPAKFVWEIALANATKHQPDLGGKASLNFR